MSEYVAAATGAAFVIDGCEEVFVDEGFSASSLPTDTLNLLFSVCRSG